MVQVDEQVSAVRTKNSCDDCKNKPICKYADEFMQKRANLMGQDVPEVMEIHVSCKHHLPENANITVNRQVELR